VAFVASGNTSTQTTTDAALALTGAPATATTHHALSPLRLFLILLAAFALILGLLVPHLPSWLRRVDLRHDGEAKRRAAVVTTAASPRRH
jgi:hypothetical protein